MSTALVEQLAAVEEIKQLKARYFRLLDTQRWDEWRQVFTPAARFSSPRMNGGSESLDVFHPKVSAGLAGWQTAHHGHLPEIRVGGDGTAAGSWALNDYLVSEGPAGRRAIRGYGYYDESYRWTDEGWRIASQRLSYLRIDEVEGDEVPVAQEFTRLSGGWLPELRRLDAEALADIEAIKRLKASYFRALDGKRWSDYRNVFTRDATFDVGDMGGDDGDRFVDNVARTLADAATAHHGHTPEIRLLVDGTARGVWALNDYVEFPSDGERQGIRGAGHYEEEYAREGDEWKIASLRLSYLRLDQLAGRAVAVANGPRLGGEPIGGDPPSSIGQLADAEEIKRLEARSRRLLDTKDWPGWRRLFTDDARIDGRPVDAAVADASRSLAAARTVHQAHMPEIVFTADDEAAGLWATFEQVELPGPERRAHEDYGHARGLYRREGGTWRIAVLSHTYLRSDRLTDEQVPRPFDWAATAYS